MTILYVTQIECLLTPQTLRAVSERVLEVEKKNAVLRRDCEQIMFHSDQSCSVCSIYKVILKLDCNYLYHKVTSPLCDNEVCAATKQKHLHAWIQKFVFFVA